MDFPLRKKASLVAVCAIALVATACGGDDAKSPSDVPPDAIALIGATEVPKEDFDALLERAKTSYKAQNRPFPKVGSPEYQDLKTRAVAFLVQRYEFRAEAEQLGVEVTEADIDKEVEELEKELGGEQKLAAALKREGLTLEQAREELRDRILQEKIYEAVTKDVDVTDAEIKEYYDKNKAQFTQPASRDVRHILVKSKAKADELYADLQDGASFVALAKEFSEDTSTKDQGGKLPITQGSTVPPFDKTAFRLDAGEVSAPVKTQFGWHIIEALSPVKPEKGTPLDDVKASIKQQLEQQEKNEAMQKWVRDLEKKYEDEVVYAAGYEPPDTGTETEPGATATTE